MDGIMATEAEEELLARFGLVGSDTVLGKDLIRLCLTMEGLICDCAQLEMDMKKLKGG